MSLGNAVDSPPQPRHTSQSARLGAALRPGRSTQRSATALLPRALSPLPPRSPLLPHRTPGEGASLYDLTAFSEARPFPIFNVIHKLLVLVSSSIISYPRLIKKFRNRHFKFIT